MSSPLSSPRVVGVKKSDFHFFTPANLRDCPSAGSDLHYQGKCKPCISFWTSQGCQEGMHCHHCHICPKQCQDRISHNSKQSDHCRRFRSVGNSSKDRNKQREVIPTGSRPDALREELKRKQITKQCQRSPHEVEEQRKHRLERFALQLQAQRGNSPL
jgi:hypothetical protein